MRNFGLKFLAIVNKEVADGDVLIIGVLGQLLLFCLLLCFELVLLLLFLCKERLSLFFFLLVSDINFLFLGHPLDSFNQLLLLVPLLFIGVKFLVELIDFFFNFIVFLVDFLFFAVDDWLDLLLFLLGHILKFVYLISYFINFSLQIVRFFFILKILDLRLFFFNLGLFKGLLKHRYLHNFVVLASERQNKLELRYLIHNVFFFLNGNLGIRNLILVILYFLLQLFHGPRIILHFNFNFLELFLLKLNNFLNSTWTS